MIVWSVDFNIIRPLRTFPQPLKLEREIQSSPSYKGIGRRCTVENRCTATYTFSGCGFYEDCSGRYQIEPGTVFLRRDNRPDMSFYYPEDGKEGWDFIWFTYLGKSSAEYTDEIIERYGPVFKLSENHHIIHKMLSYQSYSGFSCNLKPDEGIKLIIEVLGALVESCNPNYASSPENFLIIEAQKYISSNLHRNISVSETAKALRVSREHLSRTFSENLHISLSDYVTKQKIIYASQLLNNTNLSNKEITIKLGYNDQSHFSRIFKRATNMTPTQFRKAGIAGLI